MLRDREVYSAHGIWIVLLLMVISTGDDVAAECGLVMLGEGRLNNIVHPALEANDLGMRSRNLFQRVSFSNLRGTPSRSPRQIEQQETNKR